MKARIISIVLIVLSLALLGYCVYAISMEFGYLGEWGKILCIFASLVCILLVTPVHELGHMLFGACVKIKAKPKITLRLDSPSFCKIIPKTDKNLKGRIIFTTFGGLAVNLIFIILGVVALFVPAVPVWLSVALPPSFYLFVLNALPLSFSTGKTDGLVILELAKNTDNAKVLLAVLTVQAQVLNGKPIEEVDEKLLFDLPQIQEDDQAFISLTELRYEYFKAKGEEDKAELWKNRFEELQKEYL